MGVVGAVSECGGGSEWVWWAMSGQSGTMSG